jgi:hypothetical protein
METDEEMAAGRDRAAAASSLMRLTVILGKLGICEKRFVKDWDARIRNMGFSKLKPRPPWRQGVEYGLRMTEALAWIDRYEEHKQT